MRKQNTETDEEILENQGDLSDTGQGNDPEEQARLEAEEAERIAAEEAEAERIAAEEAETARIVAEEAEKTPPAPPKQYVPQFAASSLAAEERDKLKTTIAGALSPAFATWDPEAIASAVAEQVLGVSEDIAARRTNAAVRNLMASQERSANTPEAQIAAIAQNMLYEEAQRNPQIYDDPQAQDLAIYGAAVKYGAQTGDIPGAVARIHKVKMPETPATPPRTPPRNLNTGEFVPVPGTGGGSPPTRRLAGGNPDEQMMAERMPWLSNGTDLRALSEMKVRE